MVVSVVPLQQLAAELCSMNSLKLNCTKILQQLLFCSCLILQASPETDAY
jgi:hypothetical protein